MQPQVPNKRLSVPNPKPVQAPNSTEANANETPYFKGPYQKTPNAMPKPKPKPMPMPMPMPMPKPMPTRWICSSAHSAVLFIPRIPGWTAARLIFVEPVLW